MDNLLQIKNMVCRRCKITVRDILESHQIKYKDVSLGKVILEGPLLPAQYEKLNTAFHKVGFQIINDRNERITNRIKSLIIEGVYEEKDLNEKKLSVVLSEDLHMDYSHLSAVFSKVEGKSIQDFQNNIRIERIKELLEYDELSISEIAAEMGYSNAAYLSTLFKKATGLSPSRYRSEHLKQRNNLDIY